ncbi:hypothetical protein HDV06_004865 [Boothiomyces sp. JEL0866]|nr:hypothetical protein HDV06_004865 [Boothiomyces sp. JEL0866]
MKGKIPNFQHKEHKEVKDESKTLYRDRAKERRLGIQEPVVQKPAKFVKSNEIIVPRQAIKKDVLEAQEYLSQLYQETPIKSEYAQNIVNIVIQKQFRKSNFKDCTFIYNMVDDEPKILLRPKLRKDTISDTPALRSIIEMLKPKVVEKKKPALLEAVIDDGDFDIFEDAEKEYVLTVNKDKSKKIKLFEQEKTVEIKPDFNDESIQRLIQQESKKQTEEQETMVLEPMEDLDYDDYSDDEEEKGKKRTKSKKKYN